MITDPVTYGYLWAITQPIDTPVSGEHGSTRQALTAHVALLYDCPLLIGLKSREKRKYIRKYLNEYEKLIGEYGLVQTLKTLKSLGNDFLKGFKKPLSKRESALITYDEPSEMSQSPIYLVVKAFRKLPRMTDLWFSTIRWIHNWHVFLAKIPGDRPDLKGPAEAAWVLRQSEVKNYVMPAQPLVDALKRVVGWLLASDKDDRPLIGHHGPGATAGGAKTIAGKNKNFKLTKQLLSVTTSLPFNPADIDVIPGNFVEESEWDSVEKDVGSVRIITKESPQNMWTQQGIKTKMYTQTDEGQIRLSHYVKYSDQSKSRDLALAGSDISSDDSLPVTVDLQEASDRVSAQLVYELFPTEWVRVLFAARSVACKTPKHGVVTLGMFAGMGSATTFPVQTTVFTAIAVLATVIEIFRKENGYLDTYDLMIDDVLEMTPLFFGWKADLRPSYRTSSRYIKSIRVYGDDIEVPDLATTTLYDLLGQCGLKVNQNKSFIGLDAVRESCGIYAIGGVDITPVRYRVPVTSNGGQVDTSAFEGLRALANLSFFHGYRTLNRFAMRTALNSELFMSSKERHRQVRYHDQRGWVQPYVGRDDIKKDQKYPIYVETYSEKATLLFEADRGPKAHYLGWLTARSPSIPDGTIKAYGTLHDCISVITVDPQTQKDPNDVEWYHLTFAYKQMLWADHQSEAHGRIPRGIRLVVRNALHKPGTIGPDQLAWGWAPR